MLLTLVCQMLMVGVWGESAPNTVLSPHNSNAGLSGLRLRERRQTNRDWLLFPTRETLPFNNIGLAYRSILPQSSSNGARYTEYYRNRNLFTGNDNINVGGRYNEVAPDLKSLTTAQSRVKSAPATEPNDNEGGLRPSTTQQMSSGGGPGPVPYYRNRESKTRRISEGEESMIVFPGSVSRSSAMIKNDKRNVNLDDDYVPPPLKTLDKGALESLKMLLESRRKAISIENRRKTGIRAQGVAAGDISSNILEIKVRPPCAKDGYCEGVDSYPKEFLNSVLKKEITPEIFQEVFGDATDNKTNASDLAGRDGLNLMFDQPLCSAVEHTIYPQVAENKDGNYMYIVNHDDYIQGVRVEKCMNEKSPCLYLEGALTGYQSTCRQKYIYRKLLAFTRDGKATTDTFRLPACCVCHVRSTFVDDRINTSGFTDAEDEPSDLVTRVNATELDMSNDETETATEILHDEAIPTISTIGNEKDILTIRDNLSTGVIIMNGTDASISINTNATPIFGNRMFF